MESVNAIVRLADQPALDVVAEPLARAVRGAYSSAGAPGQMAKNAAHGVWLGHPLHPVFTDIPLGAWTTALVLDAVGAVRNDRALEEAGDVAIAVGLAGAAGAAVTGLTDWSETSGRSRRTGLVHGLLNIGATMLYVAAYALRRRGARASGQTCAIAGYSVAIGAAWLGGDLVFDQRVGVTHADGSEPARFTAVAKSTDVADDKMKHVRKDDVDALLLRKHGAVCAMAHSCTHMGGPLSEGTLKEESVVCPWHGSEFGLEDGHVINGPATQNQPCFDVRERAGQIAIKGQA